MILSAAPIIHARTETVDFRSNLLVVPAAFQPEDVQWARKYILDSTRYFELADKSGRRVVFSNQNVVVCGLSIRIRDLYELCGKEPNYHQVDGARTNYAFIGYVFPRACVTEPFCIPYDTYLNLFETYMKLRWKDSDSDPLCFVSTKVPYSDIEVPVATAVSTALDPSGPYPLAIDVNVAPIDSLCAQAAIIAARKPGFGFCSDIPAAKCMLESDFHVVTSKKAVSINEALKNAQAIKLKDEPLPQKDDVSDRKKPKLWLLIAVAVLVYLILKILNS